MKMFEMKKNGRYGVGFIDPNTINQKIWEEFSREDTERFLLEFLKKLNTQPEILLPYNFGWVLLYLVLQILFFAY